MNLSEWWSNFLDGLKGPQSDKSDVNVKGSGTLPIKDKGPMLTVSDTEIVSEEEMSSTTLDEDKIEEINTDVTSDDVHGINIDMSDFDHDK